MEINAYFQNPERRRKSGLSNQGTITVTPLEGIYWEVKYYCLTDEKGSSAHAKIYTRGPLYVGNSKALPLKLDIQKIKTLASLGITTPRIKYIDPENNVAIFEDFGKRLEILELETTLPDQFEKTMKAVLSSFAAIHSQDKDVFGPYTGCREAKKLENCNPSDILKLINSDGVLGSGLHQPDCLDKVLKLAKKIEGYLSLDECLTVGAMYNSELIFIKADSAIFTNYAWASARNPNMDILYALGWALPAGLADAVEIKK